MLYEVTLTSQFYDNIFVNRWTYNSTGDSASVLGSFGLASAMGFIPAGGIYPSGTLFAAIRDAVSNFTGFRTASVRALRDYAPTDFYETPFFAGVNGFRTGDPASPVLAFGFRTTRTRTDVRRATKRIGGISEDDLSQGGRLIQSAREAVQLVADRMGAVLSYVDEGNTVSYIPVVCKRNRTVDPEDGEISYPYFPTLAEQLQNISSGFLWEPYPEARSQVSRQHGRGQ